VTMDPEMIAEWGEFAIDHGWEVATHGAEMVEQVAEGVQEVTHAILYPYDTYKEITGPDADPPPDVQIPLDAEETTMRSSSVAYEEMPPA
jgi:hypothetical protein